MKINIITPDYAYNKIVQLKLQYEYSIMLILCKTYKMHIKLLFKQVFFDIFNFFDYITAPNFVKPDIITPLGLFSKLVQLTL
jgi:hypothetical protein